MPNRSKGARIDQFSVPPSCVSQNVCAIRAHASINCHMKDRKTENQRDNYNQISGIYANFSFRTKLFGRVALAPQSLAMSLQVVMVVTNLHK